MTIKEIIQQLKDLVALHEKEQRELFSYQRTDKFGCQFMKQHGFYEETPYPGSRRLWVSKPLDLDDVFTLRDIQALSSTEFNVFIMYTDPNSLPNQLQARPLFFDFKTSSAKIKKLHPRQLLRIRASVSGVIACYDDFRLGYDTYVTFRYVTAIKGEA